MLHVSFPEVSTKCDANRNTCMQCTKFNPAMHAYFLNDFPLNTQVDINCMLITVRKLTFIFKSRELSLAGGELEG